MGQGEAVWEQDGASCDEGTWQLDRTSLEAGWDRWGRKDSRWEQPDSWMGPKRRKRLEDRDMGGNRLWVIQIDEAFHSTGLPDGHEGGLQLWDGHHGRLWLHLQLGLWFQVCGGHGLRDVMVLSIS